MMPLAALALLAAPAPKGEPPAPPAGPEVELRCVDDTVLKVRLLDEKLELETKYGTLRIPAAEVKRIEFATRVPPGDAERIAAALSGLASSEFKVRERAAAELKDFRARAFPAVLKAADHTDPEVVERAKAVAAHIRAKVPAAHLETRDQDVVYTDDSKIAGRLTAASLRVKTFPFGEQALRVADARSYGGPPVDEGANAPPAPVTLMDYMNKFGTEVTFKVTGQAGGANPGGVAMVRGPGGVMMNVQTAVWGSDQYTLDSAVAVAAVHAGVVQPGQTAAVRIRVVQSPPQFAGTTRNGVTTMPFGFFNGGAFEFVRK